jgi:hypothetical protein
VDILAAEEVSNLAEFPLPAEQGCRLVGEVVRATCKRLERWKVGGEIRVEQLVDPLRFEEITQPVVAEIEKLGPRGKGAAGQLLHRLRQENLAAMSGRQEPGEAIQGSREVVAARVRFGLPGM